MCLVSPYMRKLRTWEENIPTSAHGTMTVWVESSVQSVMGIPMSMSMMNMET